MTKFLIALVSMTVLLAGCLAENPVDAEPPAESPTQDCVAWKEHRTVTVHPGDRTDHHPVWTENAYSYVNLNWMALASHVERLEINATWDDAMPNPEALWMQVADDRHDSIATINRTMPLTWTVTKEQLQGVTGPEFQVRVSVASTEPTPLDVGAGVAVTEFDVNVQVTQVVC